MRDPDLVQRAERAATALEQAWLHWSARQGLGTGPLPPVSSYVGYSVEEPWGQPRVVFGMDAEQAERLAAVLEGHQGGGPVRSEAGARSGQRGQDSAPWAWSVPGAAPGVPAQASQPGSAQPGSRPEIARPEPGRQEPAWSGPGWSEPARPELARPESARPEPARPDLAQPESARPEPGRSEPAKPITRYETDRFEPERYEPAKYEPARYESAQLESAQRESAQLDSAQRESAQLDSAQRQAVQRESAQRVPVWSEPAPRVPVWPVSGSRVPVWSEPAQLTSSMPAEVPAARSARPAQPVQYAAAPALDETELAADDLTAEQPILPLALRQAAALADQPAELPDDEADALQRLAAKSASRPGIVALRRRQPEPRAEDEEPAKPWWAPGDSGTQKAPADLPAEEQATMTRMNPVSRLNRLRKPAPAAQDAGAWSGGGTSQHAPTDTAV
jgi:hypothetical protein